MQTLPAKDNSIFLMIELMLLIEQKLGAALAKPRPGPISKLSDLELLTILAFDGLVEQHQSLRGIYNYIAREYSDCFRLPTYQNFARRSLLLAPKISRLLKSLITKTETVFADSTSLAVCHPIRANHYRTLTKRTVGFSKNLMGFFFGFKLHLAVDERGCLVGFYLSKGSHHDRRHAAKLVWAETKTLVGDSHYGGKPLVGELAAKGVRVVSNANPDPTPEDRSLLRKRSLVESVFGTLKGKYKLVTSYCRSKAGYLLHYLRVLLGYQIGRVLVGGVG